MPLSPQPQRHDEVSSSSLPALTLLWPQRHNEISINLSPALMLLNSSVIILLSVENLYVIFHGPVDCCFIGAVMIGWEELGGFGDSHYTRVLLALVIHSI